MSLNMIKDILENFVKEMKNEKNQRQLNFVLEPAYNKIKFYYYTVVIILFLILMSLLYISINLSIKNNSI